MSNSSRWRMIPLQRRGILAAALLATFAQGVALGQVAPPGFQPKLGKQKETPLVGKWRGVAKDGSQTRLEIELQDEGVTIDLVFTNPKGQPVQSGRAEKVRAFGGSARTDIKLEPAQMGANFKASLKVEGDKLRLTVIDGIDRRDLVLTRLDDAGKPATEPIAKAEGSNPEFTEVASIKSGTQLLRYGAAALSPDGQLVALAAPDIQHQIVVCDLASGQEQRRLELVGPICALRWSADGKTLAAGSGTQSEFEQGPGRQVGLWDTSTWEQRALVEHNEHPISITLSHDAGVMGVAGFVNSGQSGSLTIWDTATKRQIYTERKPGSKTNMALSPKGDLLVVSPFGGEAQIMLFDLPTMKQQPKWKISHPLDFIVMTPDGRGLAGAGRKGEVFLFDLRAKKQTKTFPGYPGRPHCCLLLDGAKYLALGGHKEGVHILETRTGKLTHKLLPGQSVFHLSASIDASRLLTYADDRTVRIWKTPIAAGP